MKIRGWVYIIVNKAIKDLIKIGYSSKDPSIRASDFEGTGVPHKYRVVYDALVDDPYQIEQIVHADLKRFNEDKEWFNCSVHQGIESIRRNAPKIHLETIDKEFTSEITDTSDFIECEKCKGKGYKNEELKGKVTGPFVKTVCIECDGKGKILKIKESKKYKKKKCEHCEGSGQIKLQQGFFSVQQVCPDCKGIGKIFY